MAASTLRAGDIAFVGYNTGQTDSNGTNVDSIQIVLLAPVGSGTTIYMTDRTWSGSSFSDSGSDGTTTYTAGADLPAGTVIDIPLNGGFDPDQAGEAIYLYQGSSANAPTAFMTAIEIADGNATFNASLANTGLTAGVNAVAVALDSASYTGPTTEAGAAYHNGTSLTASINDASNWVGDDADSQKALDQPNQSGPYGTAADFSLWTGAGQFGLVGVSGDATVNSGNAGFNLDQLYTALTGATGPLYRVNDVVFDTVHGKVFVADSDLAGHNRVLQFNISDLVGNPSATPAFTVLYSDTGSGTATFIANLDLDRDNGIVYFTHGQTFAKVGYNTAGQAQTVLATLGGTGSGNPFGASNSGFVDDFVIDHATGTVYLSVHRVVAAADGDIVSRNYIAKITGLDPSDGAGAFTWADGQITALPFSPDDDDSGVLFNSGEQFPQELGTLEGLALSADGNTLYFSVAKTLYDDDGDGGTNGVDGTPPVLTPGGIFSYALTGNPTGTDTAIYTPTDDGDTNSTTIQPSFGPQGLLDELEIDVVTGDLFFLDTTGDQLTSGNNPGDEGIWRIDTDGTPDPSFFQGIYNDAPSLLGASSLFINHAPQVLSSTEATPTTTETAGLNSGASNAVQPFTVVNVTDPDTEDLTDQLAGAVIRISQNFQSGAGHADTLTINGLTSGTLGTGISFSYNSATGVMVLTGANTFDNYEDAIELVRFSTSGDNPTAFGTATSRTIAWSVTDGLNSSDEVDTTVTVAAVNDNPENVTGGVSATGNEDSTFAITGLSISDVDADPASQTMTVTLSVAHGTLTLRTDVSNGLTAGDVSGNGTTSVTLTGTLNEINTTLADATGLQYHGDLNFNTGFAAENLHIVTTDGGNTGSGGTLGDTDDVAITVNAVNDNPDVQPDTFSAVAYTENASTTALFAGANIDTPLSDVDQVTNYLGGSIDLDITGGLVSGDRLQLTGTRFAINAGSVQDTANGNAVVGTIGVTNGTSHVTISSLTAAATPSVVSALLKAFGFESTSDDPGAGARTVTLTFNDGSNTGSGGAMTDAVTQTVNVTPVNDAPTLTATAVNPTFTEAPGAGTQALAVGLFTGAAASTIEAGQTVTSFTLTVSGLLDGANEKIGAGGLAISLGADSTGTTAGLSYVSTIVAGVATIVITATAPITAGNFTTLINNITYQNTNTDNPTAGDRIVTLTSVTDSGGDDDTTSLAIASTVHVAPVNDGPDATITTDPYTATEQTPLVLKGTGLTITDADAGSGILTVTLSVTQGELTVTAGNSGVNVVSGNATTSVVVSGTLAQLTALLAAGGTSNLVYVSTTDLYLSAGETLTLSVDDGGNSGGSALSDADTATINVTSTNDAPVATIVPTTIAGDPSVALSLKNKGLSVFDADSGAHVITVTLAVDHGTLTVTPGLTGIGIVGSGTGLVTLTGKYDDINAVLNTDPLSTVEFTGTDPVNTLTLTIDDGGFSGTGGAFSDSDTVQILLDKPPVVSGAGSTVGYTEQTTAIALETSLGLSDQDSATLNGATVVISAPVAGDVLAAVTTGTSIAANYAAGTLTLSGSDTIANYLTVLSTVTFASSSEDPTSGGSAPSRTITWTVRDDFDVASAPVTTTVNVTGVNDAPVTVITPASYSATEQTSLNLKGTGLAVGDLDAGAAATVTATLSVGSGKLLASAGTSGAIVANSGTSSVSIIGTLAQINALLMTDGTSTLSYINELDGPPASTTLTLAVNDGGNTGSGGALIGSDTASIAIAGIDDAPTGLDLDNEVTTLSEAASTKSARKVADIVLHDPDGNTALSLSGADAFLFKIVGDDLVLKAGAKIDFETNPLLDVTVNADGAGAHFASSMTISLTDAQERIRGSNASEHISGTGQAESINGRGGDDTIKARNGDDTIRGGAGADVVTGGRGEDVFVFKPGDLPKIGTFDQTFGLFFGKYDVITDFKPGTDTIDLSAIDANTHRHGNQAFHFEGRDSLSHSRGELVYRFGEDGDGDRATVILGDANGDGRADFRIVLKGHHTLHADDFIL